MRRQPWAGSRRVTKMRAARLKAGLGLRQVSAAVGLSNAFISQVERGLTEPTLHNGLRLAEYFHLKPEELLEGAE